MSERHFVKYTFLKLDPAWRRLDAEQRALHKREFMAACEDFADGHLLQSLSLVGTRGDAELLLITEAENLDRIHELHVVLAQSGLMQWAEHPYSYLGMRKSSEYCEDERTTPRGFRGKYVFVYPFVKSREWYALPAEERWRIMQGHIAVGREYPGVDNHTTYSFGLDDQEFVVAFDTDDVGTFLDLVQRLRTTEASRLHRPRHPQLHLSADVAAARAQRARWRGLGGGAARRERLTMAASGGRRPGERTLAALTGSSQGDAALQEPSSCGSRDPDSSPGLTSSSASNTALCAEAESPSRSPRAAVRWPGLAGGGERRRRRKVIC